MTRQERHPNTETFYYYNVNPRNRITGDCAIRAISLAMKKGYNTTLCEMADLQCETGYMLNDKKGIEKYLQENGWVKHSQPKKPDGTKYTGNEFCKLIAKENERYISFIGGHHVTVIIKKKIVDIWNCGWKCIGNFYTKE